VKLLVIRFSSIGDIVLTTPVLRAIKHQFPDATIHYVTKRSFTQVLNNNPTIDRLIVIDKSIGEDNWLTFHTNARIHTGNTGRYSMIYRWGMGVYHISGMGDRPNEEIYEITDKSNKESGIIHLEPQFRNDYWGQLPNPSLI
jgi:hypothetical protein